MFICINLAAPEAAIEVVDLVWKGLRHPDQESAGFSAGLLKSLTWFGRDCDKTSKSLKRTHHWIEVVDLVWKGLRHPSVSRLGSPDPAD